MVRPSGKTNLKPGSSKILVLTISLAFCLFVSADKAALAVMTSPDYRLQKPDLNFSSVNRSENEKPEPPTRETEAAEYVLGGSRVKSGFLYLKSTVPFGFTVSPVTINFGTLTAGSPQTSTITLTVLAGSVGGYRVAAQETQVLTSTSGNPIPDTSCDSGNCNESLAGTWARTTTYGFGYTLFGNDVPAPFPKAGPTGNQYKQFSNKLLNEAPETLMAANHSGENRSATVTLKLNLAGTQPAGIYQNQLILIATPQY